MNEITRGAWAGAYRNGDFLLVETWSGYRGIDSRDYKGIQNFVTFNASDEELGVAVMEALARSRWVLPIRKNDSAYPADVEFDLDLYDYKQAAERHAIWIKALMERYNYKTKRALFKDMENCQIAVKDGTMKIVPLRHTKLEQWEGFGPNDAGAVEISADSSSAEIGAALRLAFARCTEE